MVTNTKRVPPVHWRDVIVTDDFDNEIASLETDPSEFALTMNTLREQGYLDIIWDGFDEFFKEQHGTTS